MLIRDIMSRLKLIIVRVVANNLKSLEVSEEKAVRREASYKDQIKSLTVKLKQNTAGAEFAERSVQKLQKEVRGLFLAYYEIVLPAQVDRLEDALMEEQDKYKSISEDLEQAFAEMSGY